MLFPATAAAEDITRLVIDTSDPTRLPVVAWLGAAGPEVGGRATVGGERRGAPLLLEHSRGVQERPGLRGHRLTTQAYAGGAGSARDVAGRAWSPQFVPTRSVVEEATCRFEAHDLNAELALATDVEALPGGAVRIRHTLTNAGPAPYVLDGLEVSVPAPPDADEILDFTGRHEAERAPQRHRITDGAWVREGRRGKSGLDSATVLVAGASGFGFGHGEVVSVAVAHSGNTVLTAQRSEALPPTLSAGELLLPGEIVLLEGQSYTTPWVVVVASRAGLDHAAYALHVWQRSLPSHPDHQPVTLNVWEAVYFDHDEKQLRRLADLAAQVGVERFVLDDGWFLGRRHDRAGLGDWWVDGAVWPTGLDGLVGHVRELGMEFGLWFEPEMVNPDSLLYREHPEWILAPTGREPLQHRNQQVLDLTHPEAWAHVRDRVDAVLSDHGIDYVKWDHNRDLLEAGSSHHGGAPGVHAQTMAFYDLLDDLRSRHPHIAWESCAGGGGRIDLGVVERVQRFWTSDMTDALARQQIQRWTGQLVAPEYLGAHVSAPTSHQTDRTLSLNFRAATAFFLAFGIEWDLTQADDDELKHLASWVELHKVHRPLLHSGRVLRVDSPDAAVLGHGVVSPDASEAIVAHVQLNEAAHNRGVTLRVPGLSPESTYEVTWLGPTDFRTISMSPALVDVGPTGGRPITGAELERVGLWLPRRRPETVQLVHVRRRENR